MTKYGSSLVHFNALMIKINNQQHYITHLPPKTLIHKKKSLRPHNLSQFSSRGYISITVEVVYKHNPPPHPLCYELSEGKWKERDRRCVFLCKILIQTLIDTHILTGESSTLIPGRPISFYFVFFSSLFTSMDRGQIVYNGFS